MDAEMGASALRSEIASGGKLSPHPQHYVTVECKGLRGLQVMMWSPMMLIMTARDIGPLVIDISSASRPCSLMWMPAKWIDQYLHAAGNRDVSLKRLLDAINKEAKQRPSEDIWITMQGYVQLLLWKQEPEEPLPLPEE